MPFSTATSFKGLPLRVGKNEAADDRAQDSTFTSFVTGISVAGRSPDEVLSYQTFNLLINRCPIISWYGSKSPFRLCQLKVQQLIYLNLSVTKDEIVTCCAQSSVATSLDFFTLANPLRYHKAADPKALSNS